jgi:hypothetical protein
MNPTQPTESACCSTPSCCAPTQARPAAPPARAIGSCCDCGPFCPCGDTCDCC